MYHFLLSTSLDHTNPYEEDVYLSWNSDWVGLVDALLLLTFLTRWTKMFIKKFDFGKIGMRLLLGEGLPKIDETHALLNPVTLNSVPTTQESKVMKNDKVIAPRMFRINPSKNSREEKPMSNKLVKLIIVSQPHVLTKKGVNSNSNGLSSTGVDNTAKTKRP
ncbi:hypothetical protein Tco_0441747 [Tanacetum coccineum]